MVATAPHMSILICIRSKTQWALMIHREPSFQIFFGDSTTSVYYQKNVYPITDEAIFKTTNPYASLYRNLAIDHLAFLRQIHSAQGYIIQSLNDSLLAQPYVHEGDFLITDQPKVALGIQTADCLPIIFFDCTTGTIAIAHAGWQGSVDRIAIETVHALMAMGACINTLSIFFGPSAKACCYRVSYDFVRKLSSSPHSNKVVHMRNNQLFFNLPLFNQLELQSLGISPSAFNVTYNQCTICTQQYCSYRREGEQAKRQLTLVSLM